MVRTLSWSAQIDRRWSTNAKSMLPLWFPDPLRVDQLDRTGAVTIERLCELAQTPCRASGAWTQRSVVLRVLEDGQEP